tara:strand:- start:677 stop:913 length:237 start_codon:yes stop_codon:yes gene_type:complete
MNKIKKRFIKMKCKSCNQVSVIEYEGTTADEYNTVQLGCNDTLEDVSQESEGTLHLKIKESLNRLKRTMDYGIPDKET